MYNLPPNISSRSDLSALILEIRTYTKWYGQYVNAAKVGVQFTAAQPELSQTASTLLREHAAHTPLSPETLDQLITALLDVEKNAPSISISLVGPAPAEVKAAIVAWCRTNLHESMLVTIRFNSTILGGMVVRSGSRIFDWSWKRAIMDNRGRFAEVLSRV